MKRLNRMFKQNVTPWNIYKHIGVSGIYGTNHFSRDYMSGMIIAGILTLN